MSTVPVNTPIVNAGARSSGIHAGDLSHNARLLWEAMRSCANTPGWACTDKQLAAHTGIPQREIVDLTYELARADVAVVASCTPPMGRYLTDDPREIRDYARRLRKRAVLILRRAWTYFRLADKLDARKTPVDSTGQGRLFS